MRIDEDIPSAGSIVGTKHFTQNLGQVGNPLVGDDAVFAKNDDNVDFFGSHRLG